MVVDEQVTDETVVVEDEQVTADDPRRSLMDDGIVEIWPTNLDFSQLLIVMLN